MTSRFTTAVQLANAWFETLSLGISKSVQSEQGMCTVGRGYFFYNQSQICSCASGRLGYIYECQNGKWSKIDETSELCTKQDDLDFFTHHCPQKVSLNNKNYCLENNGAIAQDKFCRGM